MARVLVTRQNEDGTYDGIGTNNRTIVRLKTQRGIANRLRDWRRGRKLRLEWYGESIFGEPYATTYIAADNLTGGQIWR